MIVLPTLVLVGPSSPKLLESRMNTQTPATDAVRSCAVYLSNVGNIGLVGIICDIVDYLK